MTKIWFVRHAEAEGNLCRRIHGQFDTNITPNGMRQIMDLKKRFLDIPIDACFASDLTRTVTTAQAIYAPKRLPLFADARFREVDIGVWDDRTFGYLNTFEQEGITLFNKDPRHWSVEGGETFLEYVGRFMEALEEIVRKYDGGSVAIVAHGAVIRGVLMTLFPDIEAGHSDNTAVSCLEYDAGAYRALFLNDNSHLSVGLSTFAKQKWWKEDVKHEDDALWFKAENDMMFTAYDRHRPVGQVRCVDDGSDTGCLEHMELIPEYRGRGLAIQLLGQALFTMRARKKKFLLIQVPQDNIAVRHLSEKLYFESDGPENMRLDLAVRVRALV